MRCPTCASEIDGVAVCPRCGTLIGFEAALRRSKGRLRNFLSQKRSLLPARFERHHFLWACALAPIFIVPPLFSLICSIILMRRGTGAAKESQMEWIAIISAINIVLSGVLLYRFGLYLNDFWTWIYSLLDLNLKQWLPNYFEPPTSAPKTSPA